MNDHTTEPTAITTLHYAGSTRMLGLLPAPASRRNVDRPFGESAGGQLWLRSDDQPEPGSSR